MNAREILAKLVEAFVEVVEPVVGRFVRRSRWVAVEDGDDILLYEILRAGASLRGRISGLDKRHERMLRRARSADLELRLDPDRVISRTLQLPAAGRDYLGPIIEHRLDRLTPWRPEKVLYGFALGSEAQAGDTVAVEFAATSQDVVAQALGRLEPLGLAPTAIGAAVGPLDTPVRIDLYRGEHNSVRRQLRKAASVLLALTAFGLLPVCIACFWFAHAAEQRLEAVNASLAARRVVLQAMTGAGAGSRELQLIGEKRPEFAVVLLIDQLAALLPSNTFLNRLEINAEKVRLSGVSADAPALIGLLEAEPGLSEVSFAAPVTRDDQSRDLFEIAAKRVAASGEGGS